MEKLNLQRNEEEFYRLEVNDKGEYIEFDLTDIGLADRIMKASDKIIDLDNKYKKTAKEIEEKYKDDENALIEEGTKLELNACLEMRKIFDSFLGDGACQKIFGHKNNYWQFLNLMEALEPHYEKMRINMKKAKNKLVNKYLNKEKDVM